MQRGFSLVELSIVLVILGLLTGGILAGQSLIRASEMRSIVADYQRYSQGVNSFRDKYMAIPGDMSNAQSFWGVAHATPATCITTASTTSATCNGDGDGTLEVASAGSNEYFRFWQHLANAGLIEGNYSGVAGSASQYDTVAANSPASKVQASFWSVANFGTIASGDTVYYEGTYGNSFQLGADNGGPSGNADAALIKAEEMWGIDMKLDDGKPAYGKLLAMEGRGNCITSTTPSSAEYKLTDTSISCSLIFRQQF